MASDTETGAVYSDVDFAADDELLWVWLGAKKNDSSDHSSDYYTVQGTWRSQPCEGSTVFICEFKPDEIITESKAFTFDRLNLPSQSIHLWWKSMSIDFEVEEVRANGLVVKWRIENHFPDVEWTSSQLNGYVETPDFRGKYEEELYQADRLAKLTLKIPDDLGYRSENSTLNVNLQTEMVENSEWKENVVYTAGVIFKYHSERKSWEEAKKVCIKSGSQLASVRDHDEHEVLRGLPSTKEGGVWLGGTLSSLDGHWSWVDGREWKFTWWDRDNEYPKNDSRKTKLAMFELRVWRNYSPKARLPFICRNTALTLTGVTNHTWMYKVGDLASSQITVLWEYKFSDQKVLDRWKSTKRTGFSLSWYILDHNGSKVDYIFTDTDKWMKSYEVNPVFGDNTSPFVYFVNLSSKAIEKKIDHETFMTKLVDYREYKKIGNWSISR